MEKRPRLAGRVIAGLLAVLLALPARAQEGLAAVAQNQSCTVEELLDSGQFTPGDSVSDWFAVAAGPVEIHGTVFDLDTKRPERVVF